MRRAVAAAIAALGFAAIASAEVDLGGPNIEDVGQHLTRDASLPLVGVWKTACSDGFGVAIDRAGADLYSISFCGPGGCFSPGTYRPNSPIATDRSYRVLDANHVQMSGLDGFTDYYRCE